MFGIFVHFFSHGNVVIFIFSIRRNFELVQSRGNEYQFVVSSNFIRSIDNPVDVLARSLLSSVLIAIFLSKRKILVIQWRGMYANEQFAGRTQWARPACTIVSTNLHEVRAGTAQKLKLTRFLIANSYRGYVRRLLILLRRISFCQHRTHTCGKCKFLFRRSICVFLFISRTVFFLLAVYSSW